jgi:Tfp pilus assembly protein PilF
LDLLGKIYNDQGDEKKAKSTYLKAIKVAQKQGVDFKPYEDKSLDLNG